MGYSVHQKKEAPNETLPGYPLLPICAAFPKLQNQYAKRAKIGEWLVAKKWIAPDQLSVALKEQARRPRRLGELMLELGFISSGQLLEALSDLSDLPSVSLVSQILDPFLVRKIPQEDATRHQLVLFQQEGDDFHLAMADPEDILALDKMRLLLGNNAILLPYHATTKDIADALEIYYPHPAVDTLEGEVTRLVNEIILEAVRLKASDIHLSPTASRIDVHYRQDGLLNLKHTLHKERWPSISVRLKIMASLDIAESRHPQNGRFSLTVGGREVDFRLSCHPTIHGESLVLRILDKAQSLRTLDELGFEKQDVEILKHLVSLPQGMIILSGPTGAGKTTTLYALLNHIDALTRNIMTLEEPVEYCLPHIRQTEIREGGTFRFGDGIRSLLRQDPDVIFISEIRDEETAQMALRAALTGHLVLGTIHARDNFSVPHRLADLGIAPSLLKENLVAGLTQRLVRRLCEACRHPRIITCSDRNHYALPESIAHVYEATGCASCQETGYKGREAIAEVVLFNDLRDMRPQDPSRQTSSNPCFPTLWDRAIGKVLEGKTTFSEIDRVIGKRS